MVERAITYGQLRRFLMELGFEDRSDKYLIFQHPDAAGAALHLAMHPLDEPVLGRDLASAKAVLALSGLMEREAFDRWVWEEKTRAAAS